jgi:hypothetical protein
MGGTPKRMEQFAYYIMEQIGHKLPAGTTLQDISQYSYRYCMYKVGPVLSISVSTQFENNNFDFVIITTKMLTLGLFGIFSKTFARKSRNYSFSSFFCAFDSN